MKIKDVTVTVTPRVHLSFIFKLSPGGPSNTEKISENHKYKLISSSLTALGVRIPRSVKRRVMREGGV